MGLLKMAISVSHAPLERSLSSDIRTSVFPVPKDPPLGQQEELLVVSRVYLNRVFPKCCSEFTEFSDKKCLSLE